MGFNYLIDTNILIYFINNEIPLQEFEKVKEIIKKSFNISCITKIELLGWNKLKERNIVKLKSFISNSNIISLNDELIEKTISIKQNTNLKTPNAVIGATAIHNNLILVTRNTKDFGKIDSIEIYNPFASQG